MPKPGEKTYADIIAKAWGTTATAPDPVEPKVEPEVSPAEAVTEAQPERKMTRMERHKAGIYYPFEKKPEPKAEKPEWAKPQRVVDLDTLKEAPVVDGVRFELWETPEGKGRVQAVDEDSGENVAGITIYPDYASAEAVHQDVVQKAKRMAGSEIAQRAQEQYAGWKGKPEKVKGQKLIEKRLKEIGQAKDLAYDSAIYDKGVALRKLEAEESKLRSQLHPITEPEPVSVKESPTRADLVDIEESRSEVAQTADVAQKHSIVVSPDSPEVEKWIEDPGTMDVQGIDTPPVKKPRKPRKPKAEAPVKRERKPRVVRKAKPKAEKPKGKRLLRSELMEIQEGRSTRSIGSDVARKHSTVVPVTSQKTRQWAKDQGSMDIQGIDTPGSKTPRITDTKAGISRKGTPHITGRGGVRITKRMPRLK